MLKIPHILVGCSIASVAWCGHSWAQTQQPSSTPKIEGETPQTKPGGGQSISENNQRGTENAPFIVKITPSEDAKKLPGGPPTGQQQSSSDWGLVVPTWILAIFAFVSSGLTAWLIIDSHQSTKRELRAYIMCGGLFGVPKHDTPSLREQYRARSSDYVGPWRFVIYNYGKTPGTILKFEWGRCPESEFPVTVPVSEILDKNMLRHRMQPAITDVIEIFLPSAEASQYRHIECERVVGEVMFGRVTFKDIFRKVRYSTFALLMKEENTDSIGKSFADDWN